MKNIRNKKAERVGMILTLLFLANVALWFFTEYFTDSDSLVNLLIFGVITLLIFVCYLIFFFYAIFRYRLTPYNNYILLICFIIFITVLWGLLAITGLFF